MNKQQSVVVVIVTYNGANFIEKCVSSVCQSSVKADVVVVDNQSSDNTVQIIKDKFPVVKLIQSEVNLGFGRANNIGINWALSNHADFIFLLNQDAWLEEDALHQLLVVANAHPNYGILSPIHYNYSGQDWHSGFRKYVQLFAPSLSPGTETGLQDVYEVNFVAAALWLMNSIAVKKAGGFDPIYFMYGEDDDLAARVRLAGFKIGVAPAAKGHHMEKSDLKRDVPPKRLVAKYFNNYTSVLKYSGQSVFHRYASVIKSAIAQVFAFSTQGKHKESKAAALALRNVLRIVEQIESSRRAIATEGAFLELPVLAPEAKNLCR